jgi:hypothetical protein
MRWDRAAVHWKGLKAQIGPQQSSLSDDDLQMLEARKNALISEFEQLYGIMRDEAGVRAPSSGR